LKVDISAGTASGTLIPFARQGMPSVTGRGRGTLYVRAVVDVPRKLTKDQKKMVDQLGTTMPVDHLEPTPTEAAREKPFFEKVKDLFG
jgi:DnaJ-class molecular chaperone